ncbi:MAG: hypothetical protein K2L18_06320 [Acetatifactor sp.]|nr:hypothetical protein [Acetatifactor sp.]
MDKKNHLWFLFQFLHETEKKLSKEEEKQVMIEKAINLRLMCDYAVSCSYRDLVLIICMLHDYVKMLDEVRADDIQYQAYYRMKFMNMADRLAEQIDYDYEKQLEKCQKKMNAKGKYDDIGEDAVVLAMKYGKKAANKGGKADAKGDGNGDKESTCPGGGG